MVGARWDCLAGPLLWRRRASNSALQRKVCMWDSSGCIMSGCDISWVSLCMPMRPGKNSVVALRRIRVPGGSWCAGSASLDHFCGAGGLPTAHWRVGGSWGCILSGGDISWVSLCVPMRPGKNSFVAPLRIRVPRGPPLPSCPCLRHLCACRFEGGKDTTLPLVRAAGLLVAVFKGSFRAARLLGPSPQRWRPVY